MTSLVTKSFIYFFINSLIRTDAAMTKAEAEEKDRLEVKAKTLTEAAEEAVRLEAEEPIETAMSDTIAEILADTTTVMDTTTILDETSENAARLEAEEKEIEAKTLAEATEEAVRLEAEEQAPVETSMLDTSAEILADTTTVMDTTTTGLINYTNNALVQEEATTIITLADKSGIYQRDLSIIA